MNTVTSDDLNLWRGLDRREPVTARRVIAATAGIVFYHLAAFVVLVTTLNAPGGQIVMNYQPDLRRAVPLYIPRDLTQKDPNLGKITKDLDVRSSAPPAPIPQARRFRAPVVAPRPAPTISVPLEAPKVEAATILPPVAAASPGDIPAVAPPPPEKAKLTFEAVGAGGTATRTNTTPTIKLPQVGSTVDEMLHPQTLAAAPKVSNGGGVTIGG